MESVSVLILKIECSVKKALEVSKIFSCSSKKPSILKVEEIAFLVSFRMYFDSLSDLDAGVHAERLKLRIKRKRIFFMCKSN